MEVSPEEAAAARCDARLSRIPTGEMAFMGSKKNLHGSAEYGKTGTGMARGDFRIGWAMQVNPTQSKLKPPGTKRLKLKYGRQLSIFAFHFNLRRYISAACDAAAASAAWGTRWSRPTPW